MANNPLSFDPLKLLKKTEEELKERENQLRSINEEVYKKNLELLSEKRRLEAILYNMAESVLVLDNQYRFSLFNNTAQRLLGLAEAEVLGKSYDEVISLYEEKGGRMLFSRLFGLSKDSSDVAGKKEYVLKTPLGERVVKVHITKIIMSYAESSEYIILFTDITVEREVARLKDEFIGIVSHELRTPMTAVKGNLWMLATGKGGELSEKAKIYLTKAVRGTDRMLSLISDILNVTQLEQGRIDLKTEKLNLGALVLEELDELKVKAQEKGLNLEIGDFSKIPSVFGDKRRIIEILANFISNSIKYTEKGFVRVEALKKEDEVVVQVRDSGRGFNPADKDKLFNKFSRLENSYATVAEAGGTGLGLYISKMLGEKMGGQVGAQSEGVGKGSVFWFSLPAAV